MARKLYCLPGNRVFYLALPLTVFPTAIEGLGQAGLNHSPGWTRLVVEKPFGHDLASAQALNRLIHRHFDESQAYRIDHYLDKETVREYIPTAAIQRHFRDALEAINASRMESTEGIGVWVSGFFSSGKSSFAKVLSYILAQRTVMAQRASGLFRSRLTDGHLKNLLDLVNRTMPFTVVMFCIATDQAARTGRENVSEIMYRLVAGWARL